MKPFVVDITKILSKDLKSRSLIAPLSLYIKASAEPFVVVDFQNVLFVTRSFADEFYNELIKSNTLGVRVEVVNVPKDIEMVFEAVSVTQNRPKNIEVSGSVVRFNTLSEVSGFLQSMAL